MSVAQETNMNSAQNTNQPITNQPINQSTNHYRSTYDYECTLEIL